MKIGMRGHDFGSYNSEKLAEVLAQNKVEAIQLAIPKAVEGIESYFAVDDALLYRLKESLQAVNIEISVLGCYIEPSLLDDAQRRQQVELFEKGIYCAAALDAKCIGTETTMFTAPEIEREKAVAQLLKSLDEMLSYAQKMNVTVAVEPVALHTMNTPQLTRRVLDTFTGAKLGVIFDPVNLLTLQNITTQQTLWQACFKHFGAEICAMHIKDAKVENNILVPCLLGDGVMDYTAVIAPWLAANKSEIALLREEIVYETSAQDFEYMHKTFYIVK